MSGGGRWFRVNTTWSQSEWIASMAPPARLAWIELLGYVKAHGYDGRVRSVTPMIFGRMVGIDSADIEIMLRAALADGALIHDDGTWIITGWKEHQGDPTGRDRVERHRQKKADSNDGNALQPFVTPTETETSSETREQKPSIKPSAREGGALDMSDEEHISLVIRLANRGMRENPAIDQERFRPILPSHGPSRQAVADWMLRGVDWPTIEATVYDRASKYPPNERYSQIGTLLYFEKAILEAHENQLAMSVGAPTVESESESLDRLRSVPADLREWAERVDAKLRGDELAKSEADRVLNHLRAANEQETRRMRAGEREAFLWLRLLNWYGERVGDPRPNGRKAVA